MVERCRGYRHSETWPRPCGRAAVEGEEYCRYHLAGKRRSERVTKEKADKRREHERSSTEQCEFAKALIGRLGVGRPAYRGPVAGMPGMYTGGVELKSSEVMRLLEELKR